MEGIMDIDWYKALPLITALASLLYAAYLHRKSRRVGFSVETATYLDNDNETSSLTIINTEQRSVTIKDIYFVSGKHNRFFVAGREILYNASHPLPAPSEDGKPPFAACFDPFELVEIMFRKRETFINKLLFWSFCHSLRVEVVPHVDKIRSTKLDQYARKRIWGKYKNVRRTFQR
jgi:hypothetical protein